jgi:peptidoglycan hydrolase-like protein with peptidoglycan-binding domain
MSATVRRWIVTSVIGLMLVSIGWWAGRATLGSRAPAESPQPTRIIATVKTATVGRSLSLAVTAQRPTAQLAVNGLAGTVTSVDMRTIVQVGDVLYSVDAVPVRAVEGDIPFYRDLRLGANGEDVLQLQRAMAKLQYYHGQAHGRFDVATGRAVRAWQRAFDLPETGVVRLGELVAVPKLPVALRLDEHIVKGSRVSVGVTAVFAPTGTVSFDLVVTQSQAALIKPDAAVTVVYRQYTWPAHITDTIAAADNTVEFVLAAPGGGPVCADGCDSLPAQDRLSLSAKVTLVPEITGPVVPLVALHVNPDGSAFVTMEDGSPRDVKILASSGGVAVVEGLNIGEHVEVLIASAAETER